MNLLRFHNKSIALKLAYGLVLLSVLFVFLSTKFEILGYFILPLIMIFISLALVDFYYIKEPTQKFPWRPFLLLIAVFIIMVALSTLFVWWQFAHMRLEL